MKKEQPVINELEAGTYYWCSCGKSKNGVFCDGSHGEEDRGPVEFTLVEKKKVALCSCRRTGTPPFCDGSHDK